MASTASECKDRIIRLLATFDPSNSGSIPRGVLNAAFAQILQPQWPLSQDDLGDFIGECLDRFDAQRVKYRPLVEWLYSEQWNEEVEDKRQLDILLEDVEKICIDMERTPREEECSPRSPPSSPGGSCGDRWCIKTWLSNQVSEVLSDALIRPVSEKLPEHPDVELAFARALGKAKQQDAEWIVLDLLVRGEILQTLTEKVVASAQELVKAQAVTGEELNAKFQSEEGTFRMTFGQTADFFSGLEDLIGSPSPHVRMAMESEHCKQPDSNEYWTTGNYGVATTPYIEWHFVVEPSNVPEGGWPKETKNTKTPRKAQPLTDLYDTFECINKKLVDMNEAALMLEEWIGGRLYTGPLFEKYNAVNRGGAKDQSSQCDHMKRRFQYLCQGNRYVTTIHCINSALIKLSKLESAQTLYRGIVNGVLPEAFMRRSRAGVRGGVEFGFLSTSKKRDVAIAYMDGGKAATLLEIKTGMIDRGADLSGISQYPHEQEICFPPLTCMEVLGSRVDKNVLVLEIRLNVNFTALTIERVIGKRMKVVQDMCDNIRCEARNALEQHYWKEVVPEQESAELIRVAASQVAEESLKIITHNKKPEHFNNDVVLLSAVRRALDIAESIRWMKSSVLENAACVLDKQSPRSSWDGFKAHAAITKEQRKEASQRARDKAAANSHAECRRLDPITLKREDTRRLDLTQGSSQGHILDVLKLVEQDGRIQLMEQNKLFPEMQPGYTLVEVNQMFYPFFFNEIVSERGASLVFERPLTKQELKTELLSILHKTTQDDIKQQAVLLARALALNPQQNALDLHQLQLGCHAGEALAHAMEENRTIQSIFMPQNNLGPTTAAALGRTLYMNKTLKTLYIDQNDLGSHGGISIAEGLKAECSLQTLRLRKNQLMKEGSIAIAKALEQNSSLQTLYIESNEMGPEGGVAFAVTLRRNQTLEALHIDSNNLGPEGGEAVAEALKENHFLKKLWIPSNSLDQQGGSALAKALLHNRTLQHLGMSRNGVGPKAGVDMAEALEGNVGLLSLRIESNNLGAQGGEAFAQVLQRNEVLRSLYISGNDLQSKVGVAIGKSLQDNTRCLTALYADRNGFGADVGREIAKALQVNEKLEALGIEHNDIGPEGGKALAMALQTSSTVRTLWLEGNSFGEEGGLAIADALQQNMSLETLSIKRNALTAKVADKLVSALEKNVQSQLQSLMISSEEVGEEAMANIKQKLGMKVRIKT